MRLPPGEAKRFLDLYAGLVGWCARRLDPTSPIHDAETLRAVSLDDHAAARDRMLDHPASIAAYVAENPAGLSSADFGLVGLWRSFVRGDLFVERDLKRHTVFVDWKDPPTEYGVLSLNEEIVDILPMQLPMLIEAVLLPWRGAIVCDGILRCENIHFGPRICRQLRNAYLEAKARGIVTSLGGTPAALTTGSAPKPSVWSSGNSNHDDASTGPRRDRRGRPILRHRLAVALPLKS